MIYYFFVDNRQIFLTRLWDSLKVCIMKNLRKIRAALPESLRTRITESLREAILDGEIEPGERINEAFISEKLGVSRSPIREAIRVLEAENLVETFERRGSFVREITVEDVEEVYQALQILEPEIVRLAVINLSVQSRKKLESILRRLANINPKTPFKRVNALSREFHHAVAKATQKKVLAKLRISLRIQEEIFHRAYHGQEKRNSEVAVAEHMSICAAVLEGDAEKAVALMLNHVQSARQRAIYALRKKAEMVKVHDAA